MGATVKEERIEIRLASAEGPKFVRRPSCRRTSANLFFVQCVPWPTRDSGLTRLALSYLKSR